MTVSELIAELSKIEDQDRDVVIYGSSRDHIISHIYDGHQETQEDEQVYIMLND